MTKLLTDDGLFCQWLPLFQLDLSSLKTIVRTSIHVFPNARLHLGHYRTQQPILCLEGFVKKHIYPQDYLLQQVGDRTLRNELVQMQLNSDFGLLGGYLGSKRELSHFSRPGPLNTDDHAVVTFQAPRLAYSSEEPPMYRLAHIINTLAENQDEALTSHLLDVVRTSAGFEPAYFTLLSMAQELYGRYPQAG